MLVIQNVSKTFGPVRALREVSLQIAKGEIHALCGENGAGKSTLMNILVGNLSADQGSIFLDGALIHFASNAEARRGGINIVYQERSLTDQLNVAENVFPQPPLRSFGRIDFPKLYANTQALLDQLNIRSFQPKTPVQQLSAAQKQLVEIAKALATQPKVLLLDEPTASLTLSETTDLFHLLRHLKMQGVSIIYISHRMAEIRQIADRVSVLKDGQFQGTLELANTTDEEIIRMMVGRTWQQKEYTSHVQEEVVLQVEDLSAAGCSPLSFQLHKGEILGFSGLAGAGRTELAKAIFGANEMKTGKLIKGRLLHIRQPKDAIASRIAYVPEERKTLGLFGDRSILDNIGVVWLNRKGTKFEVKAFTQMATSLMQQLNIKAPSIKSPVASLSGGNQQKVLLARWLSITPDILIVDEPTHGIDVGAKAEIYDILKAMTTQGVSIILISSELPELLLVADRIAVMRSGHLLSILPKQEWTEEKIMALAAH